MKGALSSSETSILTRATWRNIPVDADLFCVKPSSHLCSGCAKGSTVL
jgi:hypothetical protein